MAEEERVPSEATSSCHVARGTRPASSRRRAHSSKTLLWFLYYRNKVSEWFRSTKRSHISGCPRQPYWMLTVCHVIRVTRSTTSFTARSLPVFNINIDYKYNMLFRYVMYRFLNYYFFNSNGLYKNNPLTTLVFNSTNLIK